MSENCTHEQCEIYNSCVVASGQDRLHEFRFRDYSGYPTGQLGSDPLAWLNGDMPDD